MKIDFKEIKDITIPHLNGGEGEITAKMYMDSLGKVMMSSIPVNSSIGQHKHSDSFEINYVVSGTGKAICDGEEENLSVGDVHYCPKDSSHSIFNTGDSDLVLFTVVPNQK